MKDNFKEKFAVPVLLLLVFMTLNARAERPLLLVTYEHAPFVTIKNGQLTGTVADKVQRLCQAAGKRCLWQLQSRLQAEWLVRRGEADGIFPMVWNREGAAAMIYLRPLVVTNYGLFNKAPSRADASLPDDVKLVGVAQDSSAYYLAQVWLNQQDPAHKLRPYLSLEAALYALQKGLLHSVYANIDVAAVRIKRNRAFRAISLAKPDRSELYHLAFSKRKIKVDELKRFQRGYWALVRAGEIRQLDG